MDYKDKALAEACYRNGYRDCMDHSISAFEYLIEKYQGLSEEFENNPEFPKSNKHGWIYLDKDHFPEHDQKIIALCNEVDSKRFDENRLLWDFTQETQFFNIVLVKYDKELHSFVDYYGKYHNVIYWKPFELPDDIAEIGLW